MREPSCADQKPVVSQILSTRKRKEEIDIKRSISKPGEQSFLLEELIEEFDFDGTDGYGVAKESPPIIVASTHWKERSPRCESRSNVETDNNLNKMQGAVSNRGKEGEHDDAEDGLVHSGKRTRHGKLTKRSNGGCGKSKGQWTDDEDATLVRLVEKFGTRRWSYIASLLIGRIGKQCRERWHNHLRPDIKRDAWTPEEEARLVAAHNKLGNKWAGIARLMPGRTENAVRLYVLQPPHITCKWAGIARLMPSRTENTVRLRRPQPPYHMQMGWHRAAHARPY
ncbi:hypothetical protein CYMTET_10324 [Cymbomonas tetramitiformis]|uniref:Uncharacterized protein n=1 Tax=Cymbomonas tetramitiformis TaxID=36881 RepID=A0AAE0GPE7_9CHLO|nr:hypothetical protein CYMTET_10324 [Cymbomonas tetramitiformis]